MDGTKIEKRQVFYKLVLGSSFPMIQKYIRNVFEYKNMTISMTLCPTSVSVSGPTDCTGDQNQTFCGVTFHCKCIWKMPTLMEAKPGCGVIIGKYCSAF